MTQTAPIQRKSDTSNPLKKLFHFFFSYEGKIGRLQYLGACVFFKTMDTLLDKFLNMEETISFLLNWVSIVVTVYCVFALIQKRCRDMNKSGTKIVLSFIVGMIGLVVLGICKSYEGLITVPAFVLIIALIFVLQMAVVNLYLLCQPGVPDPDMTKKSPILKHPILLSGIVGMFVFLVSYAPLTVIDSSYPVETVSNHSVEQTDVSKKQVRTSEARKIAVQKASRIIGAIYADTVAVGEICQEQGVVLQSYPNVYAEGIKMELVFASDVLNQEGITIDQLMAEIHDTQQEAIIASVKDKMNLLRRQYLIQIMADLQDIPVEDVKLSDEMDSALTMKKMCEAIEKDPLGYINDANLFPPIRKLVRELKVHQEMK